jgi:hypothetical protein
LPQIVPSLEARQAMFSQRPKVCSLIVIGQAGYVEVFFFEELFLVKEWPFMPMHSFGRYIKKA